jgi:hypothetical protein
MSGFRMSGLLQIMASGAQPSKKLKAFKAKQFPDCSPQVISGNRVLAVVASPPWGSRLG